MKLHYFPDTKSLHIKLAEGSYHESEEVSDGIVVDFTKEGKVISLDFEDASDFDMSVLEVVGFNVPLIQKADVTDNAAKGEPAVLATRP